MCLLVFETDEIYGDAENEDERIIKHTTHGDVHLNFFGGQVLIYRVPVSLILENACTEEAKNLRLGTRWRRVTTTIK